ncbi:MAG: AraC family transcriptional regulator, partial [Kiritimatiellales bacterium]
MVKEKKIEKIKYLQLESIDFDLDRPDRPANLIYYFTRQRRGPHMKIQTADRMGFCAALITEGQAVFEHLGQTVPLRRGSVFLRRHNLPYRFYTTDECDLELTMIMFDPAVRPLWNRLIEPACIAVQLSNSTQVIELTDAFFNLLNRDPQKRIERANAFAPFFLETVMADRALLSDSSGTEKQMAEKCRHHIHDHFTRIHSMDEVARDCHLCRSSLYTLFQDHFQTTPKDYLERLKISMAADLLTQTDWPMERIAEETGYADAPTLSKAFKRRNG